MCLTLSIQKILFVILFTLSILTICQIILIPFVKPTLTADFAGRFTRGSHSLEFDNTAEMIDSYCKLAQNTTPDPIRSMIKNKISCDLNPFEINFPLGTCLVLTVVTVFFAMLVRIFILTSSKRQCFSFFGVINGVIYVGFPIFCCLWLESKQRNFVYLEGTGIIANRTFTNLSNLIMDLCNSTVSVIWSSPCESSINWYPIFFLGFNFLFCLSELIYCGLDN